MPEPTRLQMIQPEQLTAARYVVPLREGGSLPAILETDTGAFFVAKFRGAGQGARALIAELIGGLLAAVIGLPVPRYALLHLDASFGRTERDPEIQDILRGSVGVNVGLEYLDGAFNYDPLAASDLIPPELAARVVWFDSFITNIDRTARNPNILIWRREPYLIDHGASLYFHHDWQSVTPERAAAAFPMIAQHVLLPLASSIEEADAAMAPVLSRTLFEDLMAAVPDALLMDRLEGREPPFSSADENRTAYVDYLERRFLGRDAFVRAAETARKEVSGRTPVMLRYRR